MVTTLQHELQQQQESEANTRRRLATVEYLLNEYVALYRWKEQECDRLRNQLRGAEDRHWIPLAVSAVRATSG